jgi:hypothetical protein
MKIFLPGTRVNAARHFFAGHRLDCCMGAIVAHAVASLPCKATSVGDETLGVDNCGCGERGSRHGRRLRRTAEDALAQAILRFGTEAFEARPSSRPRLSPFN